MDTIPIPTALVQQVESSVLLKKDFSNAVERGALSTAEVIAYVVLQTSRLEYFSLEGQLRGVPCGPEQTQLAKRFAQLRFSTEHQISGFLTACMGKYGDHNLFGLGYTAVDIGPGFKVYQYNPNEEE